jgi:hypothetical protein
MARVLSVPPEEENGIDGAASRDEGYVFDSVSRWSVFGPSTLPVITGLVPLIPM